MSARGKRGLLEKLETQIPHHHFDVVLINTTPFEVDAKDVALIARIRTRPIADAVFARLLLAYADDQRRLGEYSGE